MSCLEPDRNGAEQAAGVLRARLKLSQPLVDPVAVAESLEIVVRPTDDLGTSFSGCLALEGSTFGILYSTTIPNAGYQRFTVSHELGHHQLPHHHDTLFANGQRHVSQSGFTSVVWHEVEADTFAAAFLMPRDLFDVAIRRFPMGKEAVKGLANTFGTSLTSTAIRYAQLSPDPLAIVMSAGQHVLYCFASDAMRRVRGTFIRKGSPVPSASTTARFNRKPENIAEVREEEGTSYLSTWFDNADRDCELYEDVIGLGSYGRTLTVLYTATLPDEEDEESPDRDNFTPDGKRYRW